MENPNNLDGVVIFDTARLSCRRWLSSDVDALFRVYADPAGSRWVGDGRPITRNECNAWLEVTANNYVRRGYGMFALDDLVSKETVGFCGLVHPDDQVDVEIKYAFVKSHWGKGLASEVVPRMLAYGAACHGLTKVIATVAPENVASQRVLLKAGLNFVGEKDDEDGEPVWHYEWRGS